MSPPYDREALHTLLAQPNPHDIIAVAHAERLRRHAMRTTVAVLDHLDPSGVHRRCPMSGVQAPAGGFARELDGISDLTTELVLLPRPGASLRELGDLLRLLPPRPDTETGEVLPTVQVGCADDWIAALTGEDVSLVFGEMGTLGLQVLSDGVHPRVHPARGADETESWSSFWRAAASAGLRGHAVVLYGPEHDLESVFAQIDAIAAVQHDTGVFLSVAPCIFDPRAHGGHGGPGDHLLTQASFDLRVLAACRLGLPEVEHLSVRYECSDLKSAHTSLLCGVDDLLGHLFLGDRDHQADAEAIDLGLDEMEEWLEEAGFEPTVRNGMFEELPFDALFGLYEELDEDPDGESDERFDEVEDEE